MKGGKTESIGKNSKMHNMENIKGVVVPKVLLTRPWVIMLVNMLIIALVKPLVS